MRTLLSILLALVVAAPATLQAQTVYNSAAEARVPSQKREGKPAIIHATDLINRHPVAGAARTAYLANRYDHDRAPVVRAKSNTVYNIGQHGTFTVYNIAASRQQPQFDRLDFTLMTAGDRFRIWVETAEMQNGHVRASDVAAFHDALQARTPSASIVPTSGILANDEALFGSPPDIDGDGATDVLLVDIRDGSQPDEGYVAGFIWHGDLDPDSRQGNGRDVLYIDTYPGIYRGVGNGHDTRRAEATAAHEYQHLIHLRHDAEEATFVNEGLSEWAEHANGYTRKAPDYLLRPPAHNVGLLDWHNYEPGLRKDDYERAFLFTTYLAGRVGASRILELVGARAGGRPASGADGYRSFLNAYGLRLEDVVADFHTANFLNDADVDPAFGYADSSLHYLPVAPTRSFSGRSDTRHAGENVTLRPGGVVYHTWSGTSDLQFSAKSASNDIRIRAILEHTDGRVDVQTFTASGQIHTLRGDFRRATLAVIHTKPDGDAASVNVSATWKEGGSSGVRYETATYDDGEARSFFTLSAGADAGQATRFVLPQPGAALRSVAIAPYFTNQFPGTLLPQDAPRDLELRIWNVAPQGGPGDVLVTIPLTDPRPYAQASRTLTFFDVDLASYRLPDLPDTLFIGLVDAGFDANHLVAAVSPYFGESVSYTGNARLGTWKSLWDVQLFGSEDPYPMRETAIPVRAEFVVPSAPSSNVGELPNAVSLAQNYPNPFNPVSTIAFRLDEASDIRLTVYDLTGREVATLADGLRGAGIHEVRVDATRWASGVYMYVLETGGRRHVRKMVLAK